MAHINEHYLKLQAGYLFPEIARRVAEFATSHPEADIIRLGIGDVTRALPPAVVQAMHRAVDEMGGEESFRGYGPEQGYRFLRQAICGAYAGRGLEIDEDEIFVSDGSKCDTGNILDILSDDNVVAILDPVYPVYVDTNVMAGRTGSADTNGRYRGLLYLPLNAENGFVPPLPDRHVDVIYLCYPNNPTGTVASRQILAEWVDYAREHRALILFDAAYEAYIRDDDIPHSIYEIEGAGEVAIEFRSFSKDAGFTGTRCAWTVVPSRVQGRTTDGRSVALHDLWARRQATRFNGVSYVVQRGAEAAFSAEGQQQIAERVQFYLGNADLLRDGLQRAGIAVYGGRNAPYVWLKTPRSLGSWAFFDHLLQSCHLVGTPGSGFGASGEGYFRLSAFNNRERIEEAVERMAAALA